MESVQVISIFLAIQFPRNFSSNGQNIHPRLFSQLLLVARFGSKNVFKTDRSKIHLLMLHPGQYFHYCGVRIQHGDNIRHEKYRTDMTAERDSHHFNAIPTYQSGHSFACRTSYFWYFILLMDQWLLHSYFFLPWHFFGRACPCVGNPVQLCHFP